MRNKINISYREQILIIYVILAMFSLAVFWQVNQFDFVNIDDGVYITDNIHIKYGFTLQGLRWAFSTTYAEFWHPLTWLSLMLDYQLFGLNAGGYHMTNLILHILNTLLLFWLFHRMTGAVWKSAFVAAFFALHPLHVESVAWIAERKDVLSAFFWMLTLCLYIYYTEKPIIKRYLLVLSCFILALMSKPMVVTLPVIMILLDYWPLKRFQSQQNNLFLWQLKEKSPFFILSAIFVIATLIVQPSVKHLSLISRLFNAPVSFIIYLEKTFWPHDMAVFYPFPVQIPGWKVCGAFLLIFFISTAVVVMMKRLPHVFLGWSWCVITIAPVIGIIQVGNHAMADRYHYLPSIGLSIILAWGIPALIKKNNIKKNILFPVGIILLALMTLLAWKQCRYWKNNFELFNHAVLVTKNNYWAYNHRGVEYAKLGQYQLAIEDFNKTISLNPNYEKSYYNLGKVYDNLHKYDLAIKKYNYAIRLKPDYEDAYYNKGIVNFNLGNYKKAIDDYNEAIMLNSKSAKAYNNRAAAHFMLGQYQRAINDYTEAIRLKQDYAEAYNNRGYIYLNQGKEELGCIDAHKACELGNCRILEVAKIRGLCR
ncbi:MAG: tetratricopeptide repeat protein [Syntrophaceae bacterium]|nr:tetratricopeptide repeat protein [Syntrophaceae bacterium]